MTLIARTICTLFVFVAITAATAAEPAFALDSYTCQFQGGLAGALVATIPTR